MKENQNKIQYSISLRQLNMQKRNELANVHVNEFAKRQKKINLPE